MQRMLKWPLIIAALVVIARVVLERAGAPESINNLFSLVVLYLVICPLYFAIHIVKNRVARPYVTLLKITALYTALARAMVIPIYWLAYIYRWPQPRFRVDQGGVVGPGITPLYAYVLIPVGATVAWIVASLIIGGGLGSIVIAVKRKSSKSVPDTIAPRNA